MGILKDKKAWVDTLYSVFRAKENEKFVDEDGDAYFIMYKDGYETLSFDYSATQDMSPNSVHQIMYRNEFHDYNTFTEYTNDFNYSYDDRI